ncbi:hypothetical protein NF27_CS00020 [Candidatus Jidaibacter acanthamoeba]|uniref:Uncharacterized protein n=1 Tax=Candidatus Jidaibacter acanthamoebae TaxID=86105 RepID=A0A0C1R0F2_9RICK|nr:ankyrin repeat domain-containing protein [Candidatus Jidaibacter acanthamoeba]KIE05790.1 hypothetical protein NF27_CS00020 [Candidatus Jidaibacter acanthamoeba]
MKKLTFQEVLGLHSDKVLFSLGLEENVDIDSEYIIYLHDKTNSKTHEIKNVLQAVYKNKLVTPFKIFINYHNRKLAVFHLERLRRTENISNVNHELSKITFLSIKQKELLRQFMMLFHKIDIKNIKIIETYKADISRLADKILLSLINYIKRLDLSKSEVASFNILKSLVSRSPDSWFSRQLVFKEASRSYAISKALINLLELVSEGEVEQVKQVRLQYIFEDYIQSITNLVSFDGNTEMMKALVEHVFSEKIDKRMINILLSKAVRYKNIDLAKYFLEKGAEPNSFNNLDDAVQFNYEDLVSLLLKYDANPNCNGLIL